jgi:ubiquinone/menaquinone biosynthesis C-methylase UbiE
MKKINKKSIIDRHGLCLNEYKNNKNNAKVYYNRAIGKSPEMETSKAMANLINQKIYVNNKILDVGCATGHFYRSLKKKIKNHFFTQA